MSRSSRLDETSVTSAALAPPPLPGLAPSMKEPAAPAPPPLLRVSTRANTIITAMTVTIVATIWALLLLLIGVVVVDDAPGVLGGVAVAAFLLTAVSAPVLFPVAAAGPGALWEAWGVADVDEAVVDDVVVLVGWVVLAVLVVVVFCTVVRGDVVVVEVDTVVEVVGVVFGVVLVVVAGGVVVVVDDVVVVVGVVLVVVTVAEVVVVGGTRYTMLYTPLLPYRSTILSDT